MNKVKQLKEILDIQCSDGNWNYDPYMQGMANGLILAHSIITGIDPQFKEPPKEWLYKKCENVIPEEAIPGEGTSNSDDYDRAMKGI